MSANLDFEMYTAGAVTATVTGPTIEVGEKTALDVYFDATDVTGTSPTLDITLETSADASVWITHATSFTQATGITSELKSFANFGKYVRAKLTAGGTSPSFTMSLRAVAK